MDFFTLVFLSVGLAMDAFAVSITNGLCYPHLKTWWLFPERKVILH